MPRRHRSRGHRSRGSLARLAVPVAIPVALVVAVGAIVAIIDHSGANSVTDAANANCASPAAYVVPANTTGHHHGSGSTASPTAAASSTASPTAASPGTASPTTAASGTATATAAASGTATPTTTASGTATATPAISASAAPCPSATATSTATTTTANVNCDIIVPANPLSAQGLATPYQLTGPNGMTPAQSGCTMANATNLGAFVQATIVNTQTGQLSVYDPLVITQGTTPAIAPTVPTLPQNAVVTIDFGFNGTVLTQVGATANALQQGNCVGGQAGSAFGQVSFCNGTNFFNKAFALERQGKLTVPATGTSTKIVASGGQLGTGQTCPVTRNFDMIDQDQSDNVTSLYLLNPATGQTAQDTTANTGNLPGATTLANGSDNILLDGFIDPTLGCTPFMAPDLANNNQMTSSQALDELLAAKNQPAIAALVPENDEMVLNAQGQLDASKTNLYRAEVGQAPINRQNNRNDSPAMYCQNMVNIQTPFLAANQTLLATGQSPVPGTGNNLLTFMANRLSMSFTNLGCQNFGLTDPVTVTLDGNGAAVAATFNTTVQTATNTTGTGTGTGTATPTATATPSATATTAPTRGHRRGRPHHQFMNPSGM
ncbi:MAG: hypothetical protein JWO75_6156 [Actinomycetia bacterium]|nr:hypothetical protein [Actinomycetes bacterium]